MRHSSLAVVLISLAACRSQSIAAESTATPTAAAHEPQSATGHLMVVGGGGTTPAILARMLELGGGADARVVIVPQASELPDRGQGSREMWTGLGVAHVLCLDPLTEAEGARALADATLIWFPGGDQNRLMQALGEAQLADDVRRRFEAGALVAGTSAGAAVMSRWMLTGDADLQSVTSGATVLAAGLDLWPSVIVDQHFVRRQRWARLLSAVLDHPEFTGVGIDERTAVEVGPTGCRVWGAGSVVVLDARNAERVPPVAGERQSSRGVSLSLLRDGDRFSPP